MSYRVTIESSGHQFKNEMGETLLESALRSGLAIAYHCSSGSCGECRANLIDGELGETKFYDYHFSEQQKKEGAFLLCRSRANSDLIITANEINNPASIALQTIETKIYRIDHPNDQYIILELRTPRSRTLQFLAGQAVKLTIPGIESYSTAVASCPCNGMFLQFHLNGDHPHPFVQRVVEQGKDAGTIIVEGPFGTHTFNIQYEKPIVLIAKDSEFGAIKSLVEQVINLELTQPVRLYWIANGHEHLYMENYCRAWQEQLNDYRFMEIHQEQRTIEDILALIAADLDSEKASLNLADTYIAAPFADLYLIQAWWQEHSNNAQNIHLMTENRDRYADKPNL